MRTPTARGGEGKPGSDVATRLSFQRPSTMLHNDIWLQFEAIKSGERFGVRQARIEKLGHQSRDVVIAGVSIT